MKKRTKTILCLTTGALLSVFGCKDSGNNPQEDCSFPGGSAAMLVSPKNNAVYKMGDTVTIEYKVDRTLITLSQIDLTINEGEDWYVVFKSGANVPEGEKFQCMSQKWIVGKENEVVPYKEAGDDTASLYIHQYNGYTAGTQFPEVKIIIRK